MRAGKYPVFVDAKSSEVAVKEQFLWINVDRRLSLALRAHVPLGVHQTPEVRSYTTHTRARRPVTPPFTRVIGVYTPVVFGSNQIQIKSHVF